MPKTLKANGLQALKKLRQQYAAEQAREQAEAKKRASYAQAQARQR